MNTFVKSVPLICCLMITGPAPALEDCVTAVCTNGQVTLPLTDYLALRDAIDAASDRDPDADDDVTILEHESVLRVDGDRVYARQVTHIETEGSVRPVELTHIGVAWSITTQPAGAASVSRRDNTLTVIPSQPGRLVVTVDSILPFDRSVISTSIPISAGGYRVARTQVELPAALHWSSPCAIVVADRREGERRHLELALRSETPCDLTLDRATTGLVEQSTFARAVVVTVLKLDVSGWQRQDLILYEVARGSLAAFEVTAPAGMLWRRTRTDEGPQGNATWVELANGNRRLLRSERLEGSGFLRLETPVEESTRVDLHPVRPIETVRAHYVVVSSAIAAEVQPADATNWSRADLEDLPALYRTGDRGETAVWRAGSANGSFVFLIEEVPHIEPLPTVVHRRHSTSLVTHEGTLVQRDAVTVETSAGAFAMTLSESAVLWSVRVDGQVVRPVQTAGTLAVPLPQRSKGHEFTIEVTSVVEKAVPMERSSMHLELARIDTPVLDHRWRLLLPANASYRYTGGTLVPAEEVASTRASIGWMAGLGGTGIVRGTIRDPHGDPLPGVTVSLSGRSVEVQRLISNAQGQYWFNDVPAGRYTLEAELEGFGRVETSVRLRSHTAANADLELTTSVSEAITVTSEVPLIDASLIAASEIDSLKRQNEADSYRLATSDLRQGTVGGVKPLPVDLPEAGKVLQLAGALPTPTVYVEIAVKP